MHEEILVWYQNVFGFPSTLDADLTVGRNYGFESLKPGQFMLLPLVRLDGNADVLWALAQPVQSETHHRDTRALSLVTFLLKDEPASGQLGSGSVFTRRCIILTHLCEQNTVT